jgi:very-short-patch-repair endonuclease
MRGDRNNGPRQRQISATAAWQYGSIAHGQLISAGLSVDTVDRWLRAGRLHRLHKGVYLLGHTVPPQYAIEMAAILACRPRALISHTSAACLWKLLPYPADPRPVHVTAVGRNPRQRAGVRVHRVASLDPRDATKRHRMPITAPARTLVDFAAEARPHELEAALAEGHTSRRFTDDKIRQALDRAGRRPGVGVLRRLLQVEAGPALTRSEAEVRLLRLIRDAGLPRPEVNTRLGPYEVDFLWREQRLVVEVDGYRFHSSRQAFERDRVRDAELQAKGYRVMRVTWRQLIDEPTAVLARLGQALSRAT